MSIARDLLGKKLCTAISDRLTSGLVTETEAYRGWGDRACHAYTGKPTRRTATMYEAGGLAYVYLCYGIHELFNIVTNKKDAADAVLIRAIRPVDGIHLMRRRRGNSVADKNLATGPGNVTKALGISRDHNKSDLSGDLIWLEDVGVRFAECEVLVTPRIGIGYAGEDALLPWRFVVNSAISE